MVKIRRERQQGELHETAEMTAKDRHNAAAAVRWVARRVEARAGQGTSPAASRAREKAAYLFELAKAVQLSAEFYTCLEDMLLSYRQWEAEEKNPPVKATPKRRSSKRAPKQGA